MTPRRPRKWVYFVTHKMWAIHDDAGSMLMWAWMKDDSLRWTYRTAHNETAANPLFDNAEDAKTAAQLEML